MSTHTLTDNKYNGLGLLWWCVGLFTITSKQRHCQQLLYTRLAESQKVLCTMPGHHETHALWEFASFLLPLPPFPPLLTDCLGACVVLLVLV